MNITIALALLASGILLFWCTLIGTRLAQPPRWAGDTMVMCVIAPLIIFLSAAGVGTLIYLTFHGAWGRVALQEIIGIAVVLAAAAVTGALLARWSRRAAVAVVIPMPRPETPEPPRPAPQLSAPRKAA